MLHVVGSGTLNIFNERFNQELINRSCKIQEELLKKSLKILKSGGEIVYSTCSILNKENEEIINKVINNSNFKIVPIELPKQIEILPTKINGTICILPTEYFEGFFIAKIKKAWKIIKSMLYYFT